MKVLALDLAARTGWAVGELGQPFRFGVWNLEGGLAERLSCFAAALEAKIAEERPDLVFVEAPLVLAAMKHMAAARSQYGIAAVCDMICFEQGVEVEEQDVGTIRMATIGKARPDKVDIVKWCQTQGWAVQDHNAADALLALRYILKFYEGRVIA